MQSLNIYERIISSLYFIGFLGSLLTTFLYETAFAAELLHNPREIVVWRSIAGQAPTQVIANNVNVRNMPTTIGRGGFVFARLDKGDEVYVLSCEGIIEGYFWVYIWIPEIGELGYVVAEYLQNNYQTICERSRY